jgi:hypothetical protein
LQPLQRKADFEAYDPQQKVVGGESNANVRCAHFDVPAQHPELGEAQN